MNSRKETFRDHYDSTIKSGPAKSESRADAELRSREMADDPMLEYFREKELKKQGIKGKPTYRGPYPPNRYNIRPGYRWDGVDRSNGHEKKLLDKETDKKANEEEAYRWATRDL